MTLDPTGKKKDGEQTPPGQNLQAGSGLTSAAEQLTSKIEVDKQYSGAETLKMVQDALSADGREQKDRADKSEIENKRLTGEVGTLTTQVTTVSNQVSQLLKAQNDSELEKYSEDKPVQDSIRARQANVAESLRLEGRDAAQVAKEAGFATRETEVAKKETSVTIKLAAMAAGVDETKLANLVPDGNTERLANAATLLKSQVAPEIDPATGQLKQPTKPAGLTNVPVPAVSASGESKRVSEKMLEDAKKK